MTKIIKTKILKKYNHNSPMGIVTSSVWDYVCYTRRSIMPDLKMQIGELLIAALIAIPALFALITGGWILAPLWIIMYFKERREIIKKYGVEHINESASELWQELESKSKSNDNKN